MSPAPISAEKHAERKALYDKKLSDRQIAEQLNLSRNAIQGWRSINNLPAIFKHGRITSDDDVIRKSLYALGLSDGAIARRIGVSKGMINYWRNKRNLPPHFDPGTKFAFTEEEKRRIAELNELGLNDVEIAKEIGRTKTNVGIHRRRMGLPRIGNLKGVSVGKRQKTIDQETPIINFYYQNRDLTWEQIGNAVGVKPSKVRLVVGEHLMRVCRAEEECPYKALLPEYELEEK